MEDTNLKPIEETNKEIKEIKLPDLKKNNNEEEKINNLPEWSIEPPIEINRGQK